MLTGFTDLVAKNLRKKEMMGNWLTAGVKEDGLVEGYIGRYKGGGGVMNNLFKVDFGDYRSTNLGHDVLCTPRCLTIWDDQSSAA